MNAVRTLWRDEKPARWFFAAHLQGALGAGAGYVALMTLAYERIGSAWGATVVLLADLLPAMLFGAAVGALIDRTSRLGAAVAADVIRALAFGALIFAHGPFSMIALALVAGFGTALFRPATYSLMPLVVADTRIPAANALFAAVSDSGQLIGPAVAAGLLLVASPAAVLGVNAVTFALSALLLARLAGHVRPVAEAGADDPSACRRGVLRDRVVRVLIATSGTVTMCAATMNVGELVLAQRDLHAGATGFGLLVSAYGLGLVAGSLRAGREDGDPRTTYFLGLGGVALGMLATALAPSLAVALGTFVFTGFANGLFATSNRVLLHRTIPEHLQGRAFGLANTIDCWGFALAVLAGGALAGAVGGRGIFALAGVLLAAVTVAAGLASREPARVALA